MRLLIFLLFILSLATISTAQYQQLSQTESRIQADIDLLENNFTVNSNIEVSAPYLQDVTASLQNGDIVIGFSLRKGDSEENYRILIGASLDGKEIPIFQEDLIGLIDEEVSAKNESDQQIIWTRLFERYINLEGVLTITLKTELWGIPKLPYGIECGNPPVFKKMPHYIAAGVGLASLGASLLFDRKSNETYDDDYLTQNFEELAEPFYQQANDDHQKSLLLRYAGSAILAIDAAWYIYRSIRHSKKSDAYRENCPDHSTVKFRPMIEMPVAYTSPGQIGFSITYQFGK